MKIMLSHGSVFVQKLIEVYAINRHRHPRARSQAHLEKVMGFSHDFSSSDRYHTSCLRFTYLMRLMIQCFVFGVNSVNTLYSRTCYSKVCDISFAFDD